MERPPDEPGPETAIDAVRVATTPLRETVAGLDDAALHAPCALPGWTRGHLVAHLALNALGMARVFEGLTRGKVVAMYDSTQARTADIESWSGMPTEELRGRFVDALDAWSAAALGVHAEEWATKVPRTPGADVAPARNLLFARRTEVEIHHCDLDAGYTRAEWPDDFTGALLDLVVRHHDAGPGVRLEPDDLDDHWLVGNDSSAPTVTGTGADLAWWLVGRGQGIGLACDADALPRIGAWR